MGTLGAVISDVSTYGKPHRHSEGIHWVLVTNEAKIVIDYKIEGKCR